MATVDLSTVQGIEALLNETVPAALTLLGQAELAPLVPAVVALGDLVAKLIASKNSEQAKVAVIQAAEAEFMAAVAPKK